MGRVRYPWHADIERLVRRDGRVKAAWTAVILTWMGRGDLGPLADAVTDGYRLEPVVLHCLASMIIKRTLLVRRLRGRGKRGKQRGLSERYIARALFYEEQKAKFGSNEALEITAAEFGVSTKTIERAIAHWHKVSK